MKKQPILETKNRPRAIELTKINMSTGTQIRAKGLDDETVTEYADAMKAGIKFPPIVVFENAAKPDGYVLADGFHRVVAAMQIGFKIIEADVRPGNREAALRYALSANTAHGLRRTNADKRFAAKIALESWPKLSDRVLARICAVGDDLVGAVRRELSENGSCPEPEKRIGADGKQRKLPGILPDRPKIQRLDLRGFSLSLRELRAAITEGREVINPKDPCCLPSLLKYYARELPEVLKQIEGLLEMLPEPPVYYPCLDRNRRLPYWPVPAPGYATAQI